MLSKMLFVFSVLAGMLFLAFKNPVVVANTFWLLYIGAALLSLGTIATTRVSDYRTNSWVPMKTSISKSTIHQKDVTSSNYVYNI